MLNSSKIQAHGTKQKKVAKYPNHRVYDSCHYFLKRVRNAKRICPGNSISVIIFLLLGGLYAYIIPAVLLSHTRFFKCYLPYGVNMTLKVHRPIQLGNCMTRSPLKNYCKGTMRQWTLASHWDKRFAPKGSIYLYAHLVDRLL